MSAPSADPPRPDWRAYGNSLSSEDDEMSDSDDAVESSEDGDEDMDEDVVESSEDGDIDLEQISVGSSESSEDDSDAENSIEVPAPPLDDAALQDILFQEESRELPPGFSEEAIRSVALAARSLETVNGVFTVGHVNSETHGNRIPMTRAEENELFRLFTMYHIAYAENSAPNGQVYGVMACRPHTGGAMYTLVRGISEDASQSSNDSGADESHGSDIWGDTSGTEEQTTRADHLRMRLAGVVTRLTEAQRSREDVVSSDEE